MTRRAMIYPTFPIWLMPATSAGRLTSFSVILFTADSVRKLRFPIPRPNFSKALAVDN